MNEKVLESMRKYEKASTLEAEKVWEGMRRYEKVWEGKHLGGGDEGEDAKHREAAVVDLHQQTALLRLLVHPAEELERICTQTEGRAGA